jgi:hypothetical protein
MSDGDAIRSPVPEIEPLLVKPKVAWKLLSCGNTKGYELLAAGDLESFLDGNSRKITMASIRHYIERRLEQGSSLRNSKGANENSYAVTAK